MTDSVPVTFPAPSSGVLAPPSPVPATTGTSVAVVSPHKPRMRTPKPPKDSKVYKTVMATIALRAQGKNGQEVADTLGYSQDTIRTYLKRAVKKGWLNSASFDDPNDRLEYTVADKVVENVQTVLGERNEDGHLTSGARDMTIEAAKGLGLFKAHQVVKGDQNIAVGFALRVQVELPQHVAAQSPIQVRPGTVGGVYGSDVPIDAQIIETPDEE